MKNTIKILTLALTLPFGLFASEEINRVAYAYAVSQIETGGDNSLIGKLGERSKFQFMRPTWGEFSKEAFEKATEDEALAEEVFDKLLTWQIKALGTLGLEVTPFNIYCLHNAGYGNVRKGNIPESTKNAAERVANIYETKKGEE